ncbi:RNA polymerase II transcription initiation [Tubulinosema ratisbonensis]|uniref:RNA polymerase II transcription factor B subunit 2 n=1 Tax=Tubulinosema ratisbonensis TaxID=291195 RepID=A0A437APA3_9MICR|nr:RNA polymerase II transcription initiation [Tubulinosema ratisbonensis]
MQNSTTDLIKHFSSMQTDCLVKFYQDSKIFTLIINTLPKETTKILFDLMHTHIPFFIKEPKIRTHLKILKNLKFIEKKGEFIQLVQTIKLSLLKEFNNLQSNSSFILCNCKITEIQEEKSLIFKLNINKKNEFNKIKNTKNNLETILQNLVSPSFFNTVIKNILYKKELLDIENKITHKGFEFLLKSKKEQTWFFLLEGISFLSLEWQIKILSCLSELSKLKKEVVYEYCDFRKELNFFSDIGILEILDDKHFYLNDSFENLFLFQIPPAKKFLMVETNHKIYAYTNSKYEQSILTQFCEIQYELPSLTVCILSLENINRAFERGITAQQIVNYLENYSNKVPQAIVELIFVYERQKKRIKINDGYLYKNFLSIVDYEKTVKFCEENGFLLGKDNQSRMIIVKNEAHNFVKEFVKRNI